MSTGFTAESLRGITTFVTTARSSSFTEAAEQLGITKSAVGKSVARLEERLGTRLFHRSTRKLSLTSDGEAYLTSCLSALEILDSAENTLSRRQDNPAGTVRIDMPASFGRNLMMPVLLEVMNRYPALRLVLTFNDRLIDPVEEGVDLVLRLGELQSTDELIARRLSRQRLMLCASPAYVERHGQPFDVEALKKTLLHYGVPAGGTACLAAAASRGAGNKVYLGLGTPDKRRRRHASGLPGRGRYCPVSGIDGEQPY